MRAILLIMIGLSVSVYADFSRSNGVVTDSRTTLQWQDDYSDNSGNIKQTNWKGAIGYCEALSLDGGNWRLPNINELISQVDDTKNNPSIDSAFLEIAPHGYWSSTTYAGLRSCALGVNFGYGLDYWKYKRSSNSSYVRCVRAGQ